MQSMKEENAFLVNIQICKTPFSTDVFSLKLSIFAIHTKNKMTAPSYLEVLCTVLRALSTSMAIKHCSTQNVVGEVFHNIPVAVCEALLTLMCLITQCNQSPISSVLKNHVR